MTEYPTAAWTANQLVQAFYDRNSPRYLIRDRDGIYGLAFQERVKSPGHPASPNRTAQSMAITLCGAGDRDPAPRMPRS